MDLRLPEKKGSPPINPLATEHTVNQIRHHVLNEVPTKQELNEILDNFGKKLMKGVDTSSAVMTALETAKSTGDLRCAVKRAEAIGMNDKECEVYRDRLVQEERREQEQAEEKRQAEESRKAEEKRQAEVTSRENTQLKNELERAHNSLSQYKNDLRREEQAKKQLSDANHQLSQERDHALKSAADAEEQRNTLKARFDALERRLNEVQLDRKIKGEQMEKMQKEMEQMDRRNGQLREEQKALHQELNASRAAVQERNEMRSQLSDLHTKHEVLRNQHQQQADALTSSQSSCAELQSENQNLRSQVKQVHEENGQLRKMREQEHAISDKENKNLQQKLQKSEAGHQDAARKSYDLETRLRKASWSCTNPTPSDWIEMARARELDQNASRKNALLEKTNSEMATVVAEYKARNDVLWKYIPSDKEAYIQRDLEDLRRSRARIA